MRRGSPSALGGQRSARMGQNRAAVSYRSARGWGRGGVWHFSTATALLFSIFGLSDSASGLPIASTVQCVHGKEVPSRNPPAAPSSSSSHRGMVLPLTAKVGCPGARRDLKRVGTGGRAEPGDNAGCIGAADCEWRRRRARCGDLLERPQPGSEAPVCVGWDIQGQRRAKISAGAREDHWHRPLSGGVQVCPRSCKTFDTRLRRMRRSGGGGGGGAVEQ